MKAEAGADVCTGNVGDPVGDVGDVGDLVVDEGNGWSSGGEEGHETADNEEVENENHLDIDGEAHRDVRLGVVCCIVGLLV